jgi:competence protein ComEA
VRCAAQFTIGGLQPSYNARMWAAWRPYVFGLLMGLLAAAVILVVNRAERGTPVVLIPPPTIAPSPLPRPTATAQPWRVHVSGAVQAPGVYELAPGAIVQDALQAAGGALRGAELEGLNLAAPLADGAQVQVVMRAAPTSTAAIAGAREVAQGNTPAASSPTAEVKSGVAGVPASTGSAGALVNINTANAAQLEALPKIGPVIALRIIEYRTQHGPFATREDLMNVKGIGPAVFEALRDFITVTP